MPLNSRTLAQNITTPADMGFRLDIDMDSEYSLTGKTTIFRLHSTVGGAAIYEIDTDNDPGVISHSGQTISISIDNDSPDWSVTADTLYYYAIDIGVTGETPDYRIQGGLQVLPGEGYVRLNQTDTPDGITLSVNDLTLSLEMAGATNLYSGVYRAVTVVNTGNYNLASTDDILHVSYTASGAVTVTLMSVEAISGRVIHIKDAGFNARTNNITIETEGAETIDGAASLILSNDGDAAMLYCDGSNWFII